MGDYKGKVRKGAIHHRKKSLIAGLQVVLVVNLASKWVSFATSRLKKLKARHFTDVASQSSTQALKL